MTAEMDEQPLIQSAKHGDLEAFNLLILRYQDLLFRIAFRMLGDADTAADATQVACISAFRKIDEFRGVQLRAWFARVVVNARHDEIRRRHRWRGALFPWINRDADEIEEASWLTDPAPGVQERVETCELEQTIHECLQSLAPNYRTMLILIDIEGLSYEEAAVAAGVPLGTARSRLARARMALRQRLCKAAASPPRSSGLRVLP